MTYVVKVPSAHSHYLSPLRKRTMHQCGDTHNSCRVPSRIRSGRGGASNRSAGRKDHDFREGPTRRRRIAISSAMSNGRNEEGKAYGLTGEV
jgi:hypothetical protein